MIEKELFELRKIQEEMKTREFQQRKQTEQDWRLCLGCWDDKVPVSEGVECAPPLQGGHFMCNECFDTHVETKANADRGELIERNNCLFCPGDGCQREFTLRDVVEHCSQETIHFYTRNIARLERWEVERKHEQDIQQLREEMNERITEEQRRQDEAREAEILQQVRRVAGLGPNEGRICPGRCGHHWPRDEGCDHMTCPICRIDWCYVCGHTPAIAITCPGIGKHAR